MQRVTYWGERLPLMMWRFFVYTGFGNFLLIVTGFTGMFIIILSIINGIAHPPITDCHTQREVVLSTWEKHDLDTYQNTYFITLGKKVGDPILQGVDLGYDGPSTDMYFSLKKVGHPTVSVKICQVGVVSLTYQGITLGEEHNVQEISR